MKKAKLTLFLAFALFTAAEATAQEPQDTTRCTGISLKGEQCKRLAEKNAAFCRTHNPETPRCGEPTAKGLPCRMIVNQEGAKCHHHTPESK